MDFKHYFEAEWVGGEKSAIRLSSKESLYSILQPLSNSKNHIITVSNSRTPQSRQFLACGVKAFMRNGLDLFDVDQSNNRVVVNLVKVNNPKDIWFLDPKVNEQNPWLTMHTHWNDMQQEFKRLKSGFQSGDSERLWNQLSNNIDTLYKHGSGSDDSIRDLEKLHNLVYIEAPKILSWVKKGRSSNLYRSNYTKDMHFPKPLEFNIISKKAPLSESDWVMVINTKAVTQINSIEISSDFTGFRNDGNSFYSPNFTQEIYDNLDHEFRSLVTKLELFLAEMGGIIDYGWDWDEEKVEQKLELQENQLEEAINKIDLIMIKLERVDKNFSVHRSIIQAIEQFENYSHHIMREYSSKIEDETLSDYEYSTRQGILNVVTRIVKRINNKLTDLVNR